MVKTALTEQQIAAMAEGAPAAPQADASAAAPAQEGAGFAAPSADVNPDNPDADVAAGAQAAPAAPKAEEKPTEIVAFLQGQLAAAQAQVLDLSIQLRDAKAAKESMDGSHAALRAIAVASVDRLKVALGASAGGAEALSDDALLAEHATLRAQFESKFKAGGVAAVAPATAEKGADAAVDPLRLARMKATRPAN